MSGARTGLPIAAHTNHTLGRMVLQWHITGRCNLRCTHCYQDHYDGNDPDPAALEAVLEQFLDLVHRRTANGVQAGRVLGHINLTGGEPFLHPRFMELLADLHARRTALSFGILTNGTLIDAAMARRLRRLRPRFVQVSLEGGPDTHDRIRGSGTFRKTVEALKLLVAQGIPTLIAFTAHGGNLHEFSQVARIGVRLRVRRVWADRFLPYGAGADLVGKTLSAAQTRRFFEEMLAARRRSRWSVFSRTDVSLQRALQFLVGGAPPYACTAGNELITVMPDGTVYPCRRLPLAVGNLHRTPLHRLHGDSDILLALRDPSNLPGECRQCIHVEGCRGGLRCLAYALHQDPFKADPGCWLIGGPTER